MKTRDHSDFSRRDLIGGGLAGLGMTMLGSLAAPARAAATPRRAEPFLIVVQLRGGNDGINTIVPVTLAQYASRRPTVALAPSKCLSMASGPFGTSRYKMNPALPNLNARWAAGELAVINKVGYPLPDMSHFKSLDVWGHGVRGSFTALGIPRSGWLARYADAHAPGPFGAVHLGVGRPTALLGGNTMRFMASDLQGYQFTEDPDYGTNHQHRLNTVRKVLSRGSWNLPHRAGQTAQFAHDLLATVSNAVAGYVSSVSYPNPPIARSLRDVAILLQAGLGTRVFYTGLEGFDTHASQGVLSGKHPSLLSKVDAGIAALEQDLRAMGLWERAVIAIDSEFGRRNYENSSDGTDHGEGNCMLLTGGAVRGGIYGTHLTNADLSGESLPWQIDFRSVYAEILRNHLGVGNVSAIFPEPGSISPALGVV